MGVAALAVVNGLIGYGLIADRTRLVESEAAALDGESGMYEGFLRRAVAGWDETLLALGDRLRAGEDPAALASLAAALVARSPMTDGLSLSTGDRSAAVGVGLNCPPGPAGLRLRRAPADASGPASALGRLELCRSFGAGAPSVGAAFGLERLAASLENVKENWASTLEVALDDGERLFSLRPDAPGGEDRPPELPAGRLLFERGEGLSARASLAPDEEGRQWLVSEHRVTGYSLTARVYMPFERVTADWRRRVAFGAALAGLASAFFVGGVVALTRQAASREKLLARLAESEAETRAIFHQTHQVVILLNLDGWLLQVNDTAIQTFGLAMASSQGRPLWRTEWLDIVAENAEIGDRLAAAVRAAALGSSSRFEARLRRGRNGDFLNFDVMVKPVRGADGHVREVLLEARDVTDMTQARESLMRSERLAALGGLVAGIAHEVNTPVGVATTSASYLAREVRQLRQEVTDRRLTASRMQEFLGNAEEAAQLTLANCDRAAQIIASFKQVAVDQIGGERRRFKLKCYIEEVLTSLRPRLKREPHKVEVDCPDDLELATDPGALSHGLTNLVVNALVHAFEPGRIGRITISARLLDGDLVKLVFSDDGRGISPELHEQVFDPFFTTRRGAGGSGLGLHILHTAVTVALRGELRLVSEVGKGTSFIMTFPRVLDSPVPAGGESAKGGAGA